MALSAFDSFCRAAERGHFTDLGDRDDLWQQLVVITDRKVARGGRGNQAANGAERCGGARKPGVSWGKPAKPLAQVKQQKGA